MTVERPDPYAALGLTPEASQDQIKRAYRSLVRRNHPDTIALEDAVDAVDAEGSGETLRQIMDAYAVLGDAERRAGYDRSSADTKGRAGTGRAGTGRAGTGRAGTGRAAHRQVPVYGRAQPWIWVGPVRWDPRTRPPRARTRRGTDPA